MSFVSDLKVKKAVVDSLKKAGVDVAGEIIDDLVANASDAAYRQIVNHFVCLGYTAAQADTWDLGATIQLNLARFQVLIDHNGDSQEIGEWRRELDYWRGQLEQAACLVAGGAQVEPDSGGTSEVGFGALDTSTDLFRLDPNDSRRGQVTEW